MRTRAYWGGAFAVLIFLLVQLGALALVPTFYDQGYQTVEDPTSPTNSLLYVGAILVMTVLMLAAFRFDLDFLVRYVVVGTGGVLAWYVFSAVLPSPFGLVAAAGVAVALLVYPEWYVIDAAGVVMGAGAAGLFGISFGILPALVLLVVLAVYDAVSVYGTEHMLDLAEGVMDLRIPVVLAIPLTLSYSLLDDFAGVGGATDGTGATEPRSDADVSAPDGGEPAGTADGSDGNGSTDAAVEPTPDSEADVGVDSDSNSNSDSGPETVVERDAFFVGLGDAVMPTVLVASAAFFSPAPSLGVPGLAALNFPALLAMVGTLLGLVVLLRVVLKGRAHAGLPLLNGGTIAGYLLGSTLAGVPLVTALGLTPYL